MISRTRRFLRGDRGDGKIGAVIALLVVVLVVHVGMKFIPFKVQTAEFDKAVEEKLTELAGNLLSEDEFLEAVMRRAGDMEIPLTEDRLQVELVGNTYKVRVTYDVVLGMIWGDWAQHVEIRKERPKF